MSFRCEWEASKENVLCMCEVLRGHGRRISVFRGCWPTPTHPSLFLQSFHDPFFAFPLFPALLADTVDIMLKRKMTVC